MMKITLISVGKVKEAYFSEAISSFSKDIEKFASFEKLVVADEKAPEKLSEKEMQSVKAVEGERILSKIPERAYVVALAISGDYVDDAKLERLLKKDHLCFIIGGSLGLSDDVLKRANALISFGKATFPHQLMKVMLLSALSKK